MEIYDKEGATMEVGALYYIPIDVHNIDSLHKIIKVKGFKFIQDKVSSLSYWEKLLNISLLKVLIRKQLNSPKD